MSAARTKTQHPAVVLVRGDDPRLVADAVRDTVHDAAAGDDLALAVEDFDGEDYPVSAVVDAAQTPPFLTARRVVVARGAGRFTSDELEPLLAYLAGPIDTTTIVLTGGGGTISQKLLSAVKKAGAVIDTGVPSGRGRKDWFDEQLAQASVRLDARAAQRLSDHLGDDAGRLPSLLEVLTAVYGEGGRVSADDLEPFLGEAGAGAPWDLTDAIDRGDAVAALSQLQRMLGAGERHPLQVMASLQGHVGRMLRLDGSGARDEAEAAAALGIKGSTFPARKALQQVRKLGHANLVRAVQLLAAADLDLRGRRDLPGATVLEVLVARLARLSGASSGGGGRR